MCLAKAYLRKDGEKEFLMEEIAFMQIGGKKLLLRTIFGEENEVEADLKEIDFANSNINLKKLG